MHRDNLWWSNKLGSFRDTRFGFTFNRLQQAVEKYFEKTVHTTDEHNVQTTDEQSPVIPDDIHVRHAQQAWGYIWRYFTEGDTAGMNNRFYGFRKNLPSQARLTINSCWDWNSILTIILYCYSKTFLASSIIFQKMIRKSLVSRRSWLYMDCHKDLGCFFIIDRNSLFIHFKISHKIYPWQTRLPLLIYG